MAQIQHCYSSDLTPSLGTSICRRCGPEKKRGEKLFSLDSQVIKNLEKERKIKKIKANSEIVIVLEVLTMGIREEKEIKGIQI